MKTHFTIASKYLKWAQKNRLYASTTVTTSGGDISKVKFWCQARSRKLVHEFSRLFKIKFKKEQAAGSGRLDYRHDNLQLDILLYAIGDLPPSCKVVYKDVVIPATEERTEKRATVICK